MTTVKIAFAFKQDSRKSVLWIIFVGCKDCSKAFIILSGSTSMYNFAVSSGDECLINRCTVVKGTPASASIVPKVLRGE